MQTTSPIREARLKSDRADQYPTLPVSMWTSAGALAELVGAGPQEERLGRSEDRTLLEADFEFRGGHPHRWQAERAHTRIGENT